MLKPHTIKRDEIRPFDKTLASSSSTRTGYKVLLFHCEITEDTVEYYWSVTHNEERKLYQDLNEAIEWYNGILI